jgi:transcriptional regulator with XRE-family HTH domain
MDKYYINDRFIRLYTQLENAKKIEGKGDLATKLGVKASTISEIIGKRQGITIQFIQKFCDTFPEFEPNDFFFESEQREKSDNISDDKERIIKILENHLEEKTDRLKDKDIIIATKDEALMLWKEKAIEYEKKISTSPSALGNEGHVHSTKRSGK